MLHRAVVSLAGISLRSHRVAIKQFHSSAVQTLRVLPTALRSTSQRPSFRHQGGLILRASFATDINAAGKGKTATGEELLRLDNARKLREVLANDPRKEIPLTEYIQLANKVGFAEKEARELLRAFTASGLTLHFAHAEKEALRNFVVIKPAAVTDHVEVALASQFLGLTREQYLQRLKEHLAQLEAEFQPIADMKLMLDKKAVKHADRVVWFGFGFLVTQFAVFTRLVWWDFSWDVMEPISYMLGLGMNIIAMAYFIKTKNSYEYPTIRQRLAQKRAKKLYVRKQFPEARHEELIELIAKAQAAIQKLERTPGLV